MKRHELNSLVAFVAVLWAYTAASGCSSAKPGLSPNGVSSSTWVSPPQPGLSSRRPDDDKVDLDESFLIPQKDGSTITHTPGLAFSRDGKRMVAVTSDGEVVVFDAATRKIIQRFPLPERGTGAVSIDEEGRRVAWVLERGGIAVLDVLTGAIIAQDRKAQAKWIAMSPDGTKVAIACGRDLEVRSIGAFQRREPLDGHEVEITSIAWTRDGSWVGSTAEDGRLLVHDVSKTHDVSRVSVILQTRKPSPLFAVAFHPDKKSVVYGGQENKVYEYHFLTQREEVVSKDQPFWITCLGYSPDGRKLAVGDESCDIWLYDLASKEQVFHNKHHVECWLGGVAWAPAGDSFLFACRPNSHAGQPTLWQELARAEASRSGEVRKARDALNEALKAQMTQAKDPETKKALVDYQLALAREEKVGSFPSQMVFLGIQGDSPFANTASMPQAVQGQYSSSQVLFSLPQQAATAQQPPSSSTLPIEKLPPEVQKLAREHREALQQEVGRLQSNFCVNQWKVKGK